MNCFIQMEGELCKDVQLARVFPDSKTFVDCIPNKNPKEILQKYTSEKDRSNFNLKKFIHEHFIIPEKPILSDISQENGTRISLDTYIERLWSFLIHEKDTQVSPYSTLIALPHSYIYPGGRFKEVYYWDSYFTCLGLQYSYFHTVRNIIDNFAFLIKQYGFIPNGNRMYYLGRSHPPVLALMMRDFNLNSQEYYSILEKEYEYWMSGNRVVIMPDGSLANRYWDEFDTPRPEAYYEDVNLSLKVLKSKRSRFFRDLRAGAASGWDFSSRWLEDGKTLETIRTTDIIPVDLNCLLFALEQTLMGWSRQLGNDKKAHEYQGKMNKRKSMIETYFWSGKENYYFDFSLSEEKKIECWSLAGILPLFVKVSTNEQTGKVMNKIEKYFLHSGGLVTTLHETGEQWDKPNGWAPLQWFAIQGLLNYGHTRLAYEIAHRWLETNEKVYTITGNMYEKYNVIENSNLARGGEYQVQAGFGWTNGVAQVLINGKQ